MAANGFTSNLVVQNLSNVALTNVTLNFYTQNGTQAMQLQAPTIAAYAAWHPGLGSFNNGFSGSLVVSSPNGPIAVVDYKFGGSSGLTLLTTNGIATGGQTSYIPFIPPQPGASAVTVQNTNSNQVANVTLTNSDGIENTQFILPARGSRTITYMMSHSPQLVTTITADQPVVAVAEIQNSSAGSGYVFTAFDQDATSHFLPLLVKNYQHSSLSNVNPTFSSFMMFFNAGQAAAQIQLRYSNGFTREAFVNPGQYLRITTQEENLPNGFAGSAWLTSSPPLFAAVAIAGTGVTGDLLAFYRSTVRSVPISIEKTASVAYLKPGDPLTYTLSFAVGESGGPALITDLIPSQLLSHTYDISAGVVVTPADAADYEWFVEVPVGGGEIQVRGIIDPAIANDVTLVNTAAITGLLDGASANSSVNVIVDVTPPDTLISDKPSDPSNSPTPTFNFEITDGEGSGLAGFECQLDGGAWSNCNVPFTTGNLNDGPHTLKARAIDNVGLFDATPADYTWTIDTTPPASPSLIAPAHGSTISNMQSVTLTWNAVASADLAGYKVDFNGVVADAGNATTYVVEALANDVYTWTVAAYDTLGNTSPFAGAAAFTMNVNAPELLTVVPPANIHTATGAAPISLTFNQPINLSTVNTRTLTIHAMQSGQRLQGYSTNGATITFTPNQPFKPGEQVQVSAASGLQSTNGFALLPPTVWQFRAKTNGGVGQFVGNTFGTSLGHEGLLGDMDGDGDLDFVIVGYGNVSKLFLNDGDGTFDTTAYKIGSLTVSTSRALGDVDSDGDLDLALSQQPYGSDSNNRLYLNDGVGNPFDTTFLDLGTHFLGGKDYAFGDLDGDGDLDLLHCGYPPPLCINRGLAGFTTVPQPIGQGLCERLAVGDINRDGTLDIVTGSSNITIYLNDGSGAIDTTH